MIRTQYLTRKFLLNSNWKLYRESESDEESSSLSSSFSQRGYSPGSDFPVYTQWDEVVEPPSSSSGNSDDGDITDSSCDDDDNDDDYCPPIRRAASLNPTEFSFASSSRVSRASRSGGKGGPQSAPRSPEPKFEEFEVTDEDNPESGFKILRDHSGRALYKCRKCPSFHTKASGDMMRHLESLAHKPPSYHCPKPGCSAVFTRKDALKRHVLNARRHGTSERKI